MLVKLLAWVVRLAVDLPGDPPDYAKPVSATRVKYIEFLENNAHIIYPALAVVVLMLIGLGVLQAWRSDDTSGEQRAEIKREIIRELRQNIHGVTVEALAKLVNQPPLTCLKLLEELQAQGVADCRTDTRRVTTWRMKMA